MAITKDSSPGTLSMVLNPMAFKFTTDTFLMFVRFQIFVEKVRQSGNYIFVSEIDQPVADDSTTTIRIEEILKGYLSPDLPVIGQSTGKLCTENIKRYIVRYAQRNINEHQLTDELYQTSGANKILFLSNKIPPNITYLVRAWTDDDTGLEITFRDDAVNYTLIAWTKVHNYYELTFNINFGATMITAEIPSGIRFEIIALPATFTQEIPKEVALAGFHRNKFTGLPTGLMPGGKRYMSIKKNRRITRAQSEWVYRIHDFPTGDYPIDYQINYSDGTTHEYSLTYGTAPSRQAVIIPVGYDINDYEQYNPAKTITYIRVEFYYNGGTGFREFINLYPRDIQGPFVREFFFINSLGGMDSLIATGKSKESVLFSRGESEKYIDENYQIQDEQFSSFDVKMRKSLTVATGWLQKNSKWDEINVLRDMLFSNRVFVKEAGNLIPIQITNKEDLMQIDGVYLRGGNIEYRHAYNEIANHPAI